MMPVLDRDVALPTLVAEDCAFPSSFNHCVATVSGDADFAGFAAAWALAVSVSEKVTRCSIDKLIDASPVHLDRRTIWTWFGRPRAGSLFGGIEGLQQYLSQDERERMLRFRFMEDRWSFAASHSGLRLILGKILGCCADDITFIKGRNGKPLLDPSHHGDEAAARVHFNMAHSRGMVAVAVAGALVGIDVEPVRHVPCMRDLAANVMAPETLDYYDRTVATDEKIAHFFRNWTLGEAYIKATGEGVDQGLATFAFTPDGPPRLTRCTPGWGPAERWTFGVVPHSMQRAQSFLA